MPTIDDREPTYVQGRQRSEFVAHFHSGTSVPVTVSRSRRYPGLAGPAPPTHHCYRYFAEQSARSRHIIDVGCGSGVGLRWLLQATTARIQGVDTDARALAFAREYVPEAELTRSDFQGHSFDSHGCAVVVVDVLGLLVHPVRLLRNIVMRVGNLESIFIAEPIAAHDQQLLAPACQAFSAPALVSLLTRAGFAVDHLTRLERTMFGVVAHPSRDPACTYLQQAEDAYASHQTQALLDLCQLIRKSASPFVCAEAALLEARLWFDLDKRDRAIAQLTDARVLSPGDARPIAGLSRLALANGNDDQAITLADQAATADPTDFSVMCSVALANALSHQGRSIHAWQVASALAPDDFIVAQIACSAALFEGRPTEARQIAERLNRYESNRSRLNEHVGLARLVTVAQHGRVAS